MVQLENWRKERALQREVEKLKKTKLQQLKEDEDPRRSPRNSEDEPVAKKLKPASARDTAVPTGGRFKQTAHREPFDPKKPVRLSNDKK